ncbi:transcriptional regulator [Neorhizobium sp. JUb45]|uniref:HVO_A0114 family putative DNA-binding protein n=1 Tax=unclassified Neorhizobium TaxID=2629175 RepID=UPI00104A7B28|nr:transcriptional regulator [Neorhizobium sp. JUb45]TCR04432.1 putative transcriptional regulator [Neorhizobium sp. JUb45]
MTTAKIRIQRDDDATLTAAADGFAAAWKTGQQQDHTFSFSSPEQLFTVLTPKRWTLIETLQRLGPSTYRALSSELGRDVKRVHEDTVTLIEWGFVVVNGDGRIHVPYDLINADFDLRSVA